MGNSVEAAIKNYIDGREIVGQNKNLALWHDWYRGYDPKFHDYKVYTGTKQTLSRKRKHLPSGKIICETWANLLLNEKTEIVAEEKDKKILDSILDKSNFWSKANNLVEKAFALGIGAFEVSVKKIQIKEEGGIKSLHDAFVKVNCINATKIYPITIEDDEITECAFATSNTQDSFITIHLKDKETGNYKIITLLYKDKDFTNFDKEMEFDTGSDKPWFTCLYPNLADNDDVDNAVGISIFANHIDQMKAIDVKYDLFDTEFRHGKKRTYISSKLEKMDQDGNIIKTLDGTEDDVFFIPQGEDGHNLIQNDSSELRSQQCVEALNGELSMLGYSCGFGKGFLTFNSDSGGGRPLQTATAVMMMNNDLFRSCHKHEIVIEQALIKLIKAVIYANNTFTEGDKFSDVEGKDIKIKFDDSIFEDKEAEKTTARQDVQSGVMSELEYRMKVFGEKEEDAKKKLLSNPTYISNKINGLLSALTGHAITPKEFVKLVWMDENAEMIRYIEEKLDSEGTITEEDMLNSMGLNSFTKTAKPTQDSNNPKVPTNPATQSVPKNPIPSTKEGSK